MLSSIFFINVTCNMHAIEGATNVNKCICWYHEFFHLHIQAFKYQTLNIHRKNI